MSASTSASRRLGVFRAVAGSGGLRRVVTGYALFTLTEYAVWIAMLVYAYGRGGATIAGVVALAQLVPAALLAPVFAAVADRRSPVLLLTGGYLVQAAAMAATAVAISAGVPLAAYAAAVVASTAVTATRPAQSTVIPSMAATPDQLTAANVMVSWVEAAGIAAAGALTGVLIWLGGVARAAWLDVAAREEVTRRWESDRFFYIVLSGRYDVFIESRLIRTMGPGDHFGELAAHDWGGGYGYARTATVRCAEPGRLLRLTSEDFQWLIDTEPAIKATIAATLAERLQQR
jgi:MFS family permease